MTNILKFSSPLSRQEQSLQKLFNNFQATKWGLVSKILNLSDGLTDTQKRVLINNATHPWQLTRFNKSDQILLKNIKFAEYTFLNQIHLHKKGLNNYKSLHRIMTAFINKMKKRLKNDS